eukprot:4803960-Pleurochrysis_carterae.AAC.1
MPVNAFLAPSLESFFDSQSTSTRAVHGTGAAEPERRSRQLPRAVQRRLTVMSHRDGTARHQGQQHRTATALETQTVALPGLTRRRNARRETSESSASFHKD